MARPTHEGKTHKFEVTLSLDYYEYLRFLAKKKGLGPSANAVAAYLLTKQIEAMLLGKYHETEIPKLDDAGQSPKADTDPDPGES